MKEIWTEHICLQMLLSFQENVLFLTFYTILILSNNKIFPKQYKPIKIKYIYYNTFRWEKFKKKKTYSWFFALLQNSFSTDVTLKCSNSINMLQIYFLGITKKHCTEYNFIFKIYIANIHGFKLKLTHSKHEKKKM